MHADQKFEPGICTKMLVMVVIIAEKLVYNDSICFTCSFTGISETRVTPALQMPPLPQQTGSMDYPYRPPLQTTLKIKQ